MPDNVLSQAPFMVEAPQTDWTLLSEDQVRAEHELPWLRYEVEQAVENGLHATELAEQRYWLGVRDALLKVIHHPEQQVLAAQEEERIAAENRRKVEENARRVPTGAGILRRTADSARYWFGRAGTGSR